MKANPDHRGNPELTFSGYRQALSAGRDEAMAAALRQQRSSTWQRAQANGIGPVAEKKLLAYKVVNGEFDG